MSCEFLLIIPARAFAQSPRPSRLLRRGRGLNHNGLLTRTELLRQRWKDLPRTRKLNGWNLKIGLLPKGKDHLPSVVFQGRTVKFQGCTLPKTNGWNLKIPPKGKGETSTQTHLFWGFQPLVFGGVQILRVDTMGWTSPLYHHSEEHL